MQIYFCINILLACVHVVDKKLARDIFNPFICSGKELLFNILNGFYSRSKHSSGLGRVIHDVTSYSIGSGMYMPRICRCIGEQVAKIVCSHQY